MGNLTVIAVRHDALDAIERNPEEFVRNLVQTIQSMPRKATDVSCGNHANVATAMPYRHASDSVGYILAGNTIEEITYDSAQKGHWAAEYISRALERAGIPYKP